LVACEESDLAKEITRLESGKFHLFTPDCGKDLYRTAGMDKDLCSSVPFFDDGLSGSQSVDDHALGELVELFLGKIGEERDNAPGRLLCPDLDWLVL
jgi:hypothetical protein